jgi:regulatory protein YycH of two-component signal transduction system YycFG
MMSDKYYITIDIENGITKVMVARGIKVLYQDEFESMDTEVEIRNDNIQLEMSETRVKNLLMKNLDCNKEEIEP